MCNWGEGTKACDTFVSMKTANDSGLADQARLNAHERLPKREDLVKNYFDKLSMFKKFQTWVYQ